MFILDTNIYMNCYDRYYLWDIFPSFWEKFHKLLNDKVIIPKVVIDENRHSDQFLKWVKDSYCTEFLEHRGFLNEWLQVLEHISTSEFYSDDALLGDRSWAIETIADGWIIAIALKNNLTVVTAETRNHNLNTVQKSSKPKIPDVCDQMGIRCISMNQFFKEVRLKV